MSLSPMTIFLAIGATGMLFTVISFLFGEIFEAFDFGGDFHHEIGHDGPSILSSRVISIFITAFGGFGAIATSQGVGPAASSAIGVAGGVLMGGVVYFFARLLYSQQSSSNISSDDLVGLNAQVIIHIPKDGVGQVRCIVGESMIDKIAQSEDGSAIPLNANVRIVSIRGESVIVSTTPLLERGGLFSN
jgi:hypothetical protein